MRRTSMVSPQRRHCCPLRPYTASRERSSAPVVDPGLRLACRIFAAVTMSRCDVAAAEHRHGCQRMLSAGPQDLAAIHVADTTGDLLIEQRLGDRRIEIVVAAQRFDRGVEVRRVDAQIGAAAAEARMAMRVELAVRLDGTGTEAHCSEGIDSDADPHLRHRLAPAFAGAVEVPGAAEEQVGVQDQAVVPRDVELLASTLDQLDDPPVRGGGPVDVRCLERQHGPPNQGRSQGSGRAVNRFPLGHEPNRSRVHDRTRAAWSPVRLGACPRPTTTLRSNRCRRSIPSERPGDGTAAAGAIVAAGMFGLDQALWVANRKRKRRS